MENAISIYLNHFLWGSYFSNGQEQLGLDLQEICDELMGMSEFPMPNLATNALRWRERLLKRLLEQLPWEREGSALWLNGDPWQRHLDWPGPGFEFEIPADRLDEVMRVLLPLVRQLHAHMAIPARNLYFQFYNSIQAGTEAQLSAWDANWSRPGWKEKERDDRLAQLLGDRLIPMGFEFVSKSDSGIRGAHFKRPLRLGGGFQVIEMVTGFRIELCVLSERSLAMDKARGIRPVDQRLLDDLSGGTVLRCQLEHKLSDYPFDNVVSDEDAMWLMEEFDRFLLPILDHLHTAQDLYDWYFDPKWKSYAVTFGVNYPVYAARLLRDDEEFLAATKRFSRFGNVQAKIQYLLTCPAPAPEGPP